MIACTSIDIDAAPEVVWSILMDAKRYADWNPFVYKLKGTIAEGGQVTLYVRLGGKKSKQTLVVRQCEAPSTLIWTLKNQRSPIMRGGRTQKIEALGPGRCRYTTTEELLGFLSPLVSLLTKKAIQEGLETSSAALKARAEAFPSLHSP